MRFEAAALSLQPRPSGLGRAPDGVGAGGPTQQVPSLSSHLAPTRFRTFPGATRGRSKVKGELGSGELAVPTRAQRWPQPTKSTACPAAELGGSLRSQGAVRPGPGGLGAGHREGGAAAWPRSAWDVPGGRTQVGWERGPARVGPGGSAGAEEPAEASGAPAREKPKFLGPARPA